MDVEKYFSKEYSPPLIAGNELFVHSVMYISIGNFRSWPVKSGHLPSHLVFSKVPSTYLPPHFLLFRWISRSSREHCRRSRTSVGYNTFNFIEHSIDLPLTPDTTVLLFRRDLTSFSTDGQIIKIHLLQRHRRYQGKRFTLRGLTSFCFIEQSIDQLNDASKRTISFAKEIKDAFRHVCCFVKSG